MWMLFFIQFAIAEIPEKCKSTNGDVGLKSLLTEDERKRCQAQIAEHFQQLGAQNEQTYLNQVEAYNKKWLEEAPKRAIELEEKAAQDRLDPMRPTLEEEKKANEVFRAEQWMKRYNEEQRRISEGRLY